MVDEDKDIEKHPLAYGAVGECRVITVDGFQWSHSNIVGWFPFSDLVRWGWEPQFMTMMETDKHWGRLLIKRVAR